MTLVTIEGYKGAFGTDMGQDKVGRDGTGRDGTGHVVPYCIWNAWDRTVDCTIMRLVWLGQDRTRGSNDQSAPLVISNVHNNFINFEFLFFFEKYQILFFFEKLSPFLCMQIVNDFLFTDLHISCIDKLSSITMEKKKSKTFETDISSLV